MKKSLCFLLLIVGLVNPVFSSWPINSDNPKYFFKFRIFKSNQYRNRTLNYVINISGVSTITGHMTSDEDLKEFNILVDRIPSGVALEAGYLYKHPGIDYLRWDETNCSYEINPDYGSSTEWNSDRPTRDPKTTDVLSIIEAAVIPLANFELSNPIACVNNGIGYLSINGEKKPDVPWKNCDYYYTLPDLATKITKSNGVSRVVNGGSITRTSISYATIKEVFGSNNILNEPLKVEIGYDTYDGIVYLETLNDFLFVPTPNFNIRTTPPTCADSEDATITISDLPSFDSGKAKLRIDLIKYKSNGVDVSDEIRKDYYSLTNGTNIIIDNNSIKHWPNSNGFELTAGDYEVKAFFDTGSGLSSLCPISKKFPITPPDPIVIENIKVDEHDAQNGTRKKYHIKVYGGTTSGEITISECNGGGITCNTAGVSFSNPQKVSGTTDTYKYTITGLKAGTNKIQITDNKGCKSQNEYSITLTQAPLFTSISPRHNNILCAGETGSVEFSIIGGFGPYDVKLIISGNSNQLKLDYKSQNGSFQNLPGGDYNLVIIDRGGDKSHAYEFKLESPLPLAYNKLVKTHITCNGYNDGAIEIEAKGGKPPYKYSIAGSSYGSSGKKSNLPAGTHDCYIMDDNKCKKYYPVTLDTPLKLSLKNKVVTNASCSTASNGSVKYSLNGGWDSDAGKLTVTLSGKMSKVLNFNKRNFKIDKLKPGSYKISVTNKAKCTKAEGTFTIGTIPTESQFKIVSENIKPASCAAIANGELKINVGNGNGAYQLNLNGINKGTYNPSNYITDLSARKHNIQLTDANGCIATKNNIDLGIDPNTLQLAEPEITKPTCKEALNGEIKLQGKKGLDEHGLPANKYSYSLDGGRDYVPGNTFSDLKSQIYTISVKDGVGCVVNKEVNLETTDNPIRFKLFSSPESCEAANNGKIGIQNLTYTLGSNLTYTLDGDTKSPTNNYYTGLDGRESLYKVKISDDNNCFTEEEIKVDNQDHEPSISKTIVEFLACESASNGAIDVEVSTSYPSVLTSVLNDDKGQSVMANLNDKTRFEGLNKQNYKFIVTDKNNCSSNLPINIPLSVDAIQFTKEEWIPATCIAAKNGVIKLEASGGKPFADGYAFLFNGIQKKGYTVEFTGLAVGTEGIVTVIDQEGCSAETVMKVVEIRSNVLQIGSINKTDPLCYNVKNGRIIPTVENAIGTLIYSIEKRNESNAYVPITSTYNEASNAFEDLTFGVYKIIVEDSDACSASYEGIELLNPEKAEVTASSYNYIKVRGEPTGEYEITLVGINKWFSYKLIKLVSGAEVEVENGKLFYDTGFEIVKELESLTAGDYRFILTDDNSCFDFEGKEIYAEEFTIQEPEFKLGITNEIITHVSCNGLSDGAINISGYGGWGDYQYALDGGKWQNNGSFPNLSKGSYSVEIKDREETRIIHLITIIEPEALSLAIDKYKNATCPAYTNGHVLAVSENGIPFAEGLKYRIEDLDNRSLILDDSYSDNSYEFKQLPKGNYELFVSDSHLCSDSKIFSISEPEIAKIEYINNYIKAKGDATGEISLLINGGNGLFDYKCILDDAEKAFEKGQTTSEIKLSSLLAGSYKILVRDIEACVYEEEEWMEREIEILEPEFPLGFEVEQKTEVSCKGLSDGSLKLKAVGGWGDYSFQLNGSNLVLTSQFLDLKAGMYRFNIIDKAGVNWEDDIEIKEPKLLEATYLSHKDVNCYKGDDGEIRLAVTGGNSTYQLSVNGKDWTDGVTIGGLSTKLYNVQVRDAKDCKTSVDNIRINQPEEITLKSSTIIKSRCLNNEGSISTEFTGGVGAYKYQWEIEEVLTGGARNWIAMPQYTDAEINNLFSGRYQTIVIDEQGCDKSFSFALGDITDLTIQDIAVTAVSCYGYSDGSAIATVIKGNPDYMYSWDTKVIESENNKIWNTPAGVYDLLVEDRKGCKSASNFIIGSPEPLFYDIIEFTQPLCYGGVKGKIQLAGIGGTSEYKYLWTGGSRETGLENLKPGKYTLQLTDSHNCKSVFDFEMLYQRRLKPFIGNDTLICSYSSLPLYGGDYFKYSWTSKNGFQSDKPNVELTEPDLYYLKVEDEDNCLGFDTLHLDKSYLNIESLDIKDVSCHAFSDASAQIEVSPVGWEHTIFWPDGSGAKLWDHIEGGTYQVQVKDKFNCQDTRAFLINEPEPLGLEIENLFHPLCSGVADGFIRLKPYGGNGDYSYLWEHGDNRKRLSGLDAGEYKVHVSDKKACQISEAFNLAYQRTISPDLGEDLTVCTNNYVNLFPGEFDEYQWISNGKILGEDPELVAWQTGEYSVEVKDQNGCIASDQIKLKEKESELAPILLAASSVALGDTLMVMEVSQPKPESLSWQFTGVHKVTEQGSFYCKVIFSEEGMFNIKLKAQLDGCIGETQESILVMPARSMAATGSKGTEVYKHLNKLSGYPNPTAGPFEAEVELSEVADVTFYLVNIQSGKIIEKRRRKGLKTYHETYNLAQAGVYCVYAESKGERSVLKVVVL